MMNNNSEEQLIKRLRKLDQSIPAKLPAIPKYLVDLARNQKKLNEVRQLRSQNKRDLLMDNQLRVHGLLLDSFKKALIQLDVMHKKAVVQLKSIEPKITRLKQLQNTPTNN